MTKKSDRKFIHKPSKTGSLSKSVQISVLVLKNAAERTSRFCSTIFLYHIRAGFHVFPSGIILPYRNVTNLYPVNTDSDRVLSKPSFHMAEPHISTFRVNPPYRIVTHPYTSNIGPSQEFSTKVQRETTFENRVNVL